MGQTTSSAEESVLGQILLRGAEYATLAARHGLVPEDFATAKNRDVFTVIDGMARRNEPIDIVTVTEALRQQSKLEYVTAAYVSNLPDGVLDLSSDHFADHVAIIRTQAVERRRQRFADKLAKGRGTAAELRAIEGGKPRKPPLPGKITGDDGRPEIEVRHQLAQMVDEAEQALVNAPDLGVYQRAGILVHLSTGGSRITGFRRVDHAPSIAPLKLPALMEKLDRAAHWVQWRYNGGEPQKVDARPDSQAAAALDARADWTLPRLAGVTQTPTLRLDGTILDTPGYDVASELIYLPNATYPEIPLEPGPEEAELALHALLDPIREFPFVAEHHRAAAIAAMLTCVARHAIPGAVPMMAVNARAPGTGKGLLVSTITTIGSGQPPGRMTMPKDDGEEIRKAILPLALEGDPVILIDNVERPLGSDALASVITDMTVKGRVLGMSKTAAGTCTAVWFATGNCLRFKGDLGRRVLPIELDAGVENPEARPFKRTEPLMQFVDRERPRLAAAALAILRAYVVAGQPKHTAGPPIGSFEAWDALIRGACLWLGLEDPAKGRERVKESGDADLDQLRTLVASVFEVQRDGYFQVAELVRVAKGSGYDNLREALLQFGNGVDLNTRAVGQALDRFEGRIADGLRIERGNKGKGGHWRWRIVETHSAPKDLFQEN